jgi:hypothetical protein
MRAECMKKRDQMQVSQDMKISYKKIVSELESIYIIIIYSKKRLISTFFVQWLFQGEIRVDVIITSW